MELIKRDSCIITKVSDMEDLLTIRNFPIHMMSQRSNDLTADLVFQISKNSGMIQLKKIIPLKDLYTDTHSSAIGGLWGKHHSEFASFIGQFNPSFVLELGGARGTLAKIYQDRNYIPWTILEPNPYPIQDCKADFIKGFFDEAFELDSKYDMIVHSHVLEHMYDPNDFFKQISASMLEGKKMTFSIPDLETMFREKHTSIMNFEHNWFITQAHVDYLLAKYGFKILQKKRFYKHSIFYATIRSSSACEIELPSELYNRNKKLFMDWVEMHQKIVSQLNSKIQKGTRPIYLFGAHISTQFLIKFGLNIDKVICILDNDAHKQGRRVSGTGFEVATPKILKGISNPVVILRSGAYSSEIKEDILRNINSGTEFWDDFE